MAIILTEIESIHGDSKRFIFYRCKDSFGVWHPYGPVITNDQAFDADAYKAVVANKVSEQLAEQEFLEVTV